MFALSRAACSSFSARPSMGVGRSHHPIPPSAERVKGYVSTVNPFEKERCSGIKDFSPSSIEVAVSPVACHIQHDKSDVSWLVLLVFFSGVAFFGTDNKKTPAQIKEEALAAKDYQLQREEAALKKEEILREKREQINKAAADLAREKSHEKYIQRKNIVRNLRYGNLRPLRETTFLWWGGINLRDHKYIWHELMYEHNNKRFEAPAKSFIFLNANIPDLVNEKDESGRTPLHYALTSSLPNHVKLLLEDAGARLDISSDEANDLLTLAKEEFKSRADILERQNNRKVNYTNEHLGPIPEFILREHRYAECKYDDAIKIFDIINDHIEKTKV